MLSYAVPHSDPPKPDAAAPADPPQTGLAFQASSLPGVKASPAIDDTYQLMPGLLPCVLDTAIQSDLPGPLLCHLPGPVYSPKGVLLMEAGTQVIGRYQSMGRNGESRLMAVSTYAHTPNGIWVPLAGNPMADDLGRTGFAGAVDNHYLERFGGAVILSLTESGLGILQAAVSKGGNTYISTDSANNLAEQILQSQINIAPDLFEAPGRDDRDLADHADRLLRQLPHPPGAAMRNGEATLRHLLAPIQDALDDPATTELVVQRPGEVGIEQHGEWSWRSVEAFDFQRLDAIGLLAGSLLSKPFDPAHPICMTTLPDGQRCTLLRPPVTAPGTISVTIRIPSKAVHTVRDPDFGDLMREAEIPAFAGRPDRHSRSPGGPLARGRDPRVDPRVDPGDADAELLALYQAQDWPAFFALAVKAKKTIAATGSTGSGKTSLLRRLMQEIPGEERLVTIEDTDEFGPLPLRNRVSLFYGSANVSAENAVEASLRMRPDRVAMQELRGAEAFAYLRLLAAGHPGGLTTWHAEEGDPFTPLALMAKTSEAGRNIPDDKLLAILSSLIDIVAFCRRDARGFSVPSVYYRAAEAAP